MSNISICFICKHPVSETGLRRHLGLWSRWEVRKPRSREKSIKEETGTHTYTAFLRFNLFPLYSFVQKCILRTIWMLGIFCLSLSFWWTFVWWSYRHGSLGISVLLLGREVDCDCPKGHMFDLGLPKPLLIHVNKGSRRSHTSQSQVFIWASLSRE